MSALTSASQIPNFNASNYLEGKGDELDKEAFLLLLVTQFQYQDPLSPSEDTEFVAQLAQFTSLEQMMNLNESMEGLVTEQQKQMTLSAASLIGRDVSARGWNVSVEDGVVSQILYAHDVDIAQGVGNIFGSDGTLVASIPIYQTAAGVHEFEWNGKNTEGITVPNGVYTLAIAAQDANGESVLTDAQISGRVDAVSSYEGTQLLRLSDGRVVSLTEVAEILEAGVINQEEEDTEDPSIEDLLDTDGDDLLESTTAADSLTGGGGSDTFKFTPDDFSDAIEDRITDFNVDEDILDLSAYKDSDYTFTIHGETSINKSTITITDTTDTSKSQTIVFEGVRLEDYSSVQEQLTNLNDGDGIIKFN